MEENGDEYKGSEDDNGEEYKRSEEENGEEYKANDEDMYEHRIKELEEQLDEYEKALSQMTKSDKKLIRDLDEANGTIEELNFKLKNVEDENATMRKQIEIHQGEVTMLDDRLLSLEREKKRTDGLLASLQEEMKTEENKYAALVSSKVRLEQIIEELEESLTKEKRMRAEVEKAKRKVDAEFKMQSFSLDDALRVKKEAEEAIKRRDETINTLNSRINNEHAVLTASHKQIKMLQEKLAEAETELDKERDMRAKAEKRKHEMSREIESVNERLQEKDTIASEHLELVRKRDGELQKLRCDLEDAIAKYDEMNGQLKKKHAQAVEEMGKQLEELQKEKVKFDKERNEWKSTMYNLQNEIEQHRRDKLALEKLNKQLEQNLTESTQVLAETTHKVDELNNEKIKLSQDNSELARQMDESDSKILNLSKAKQLLQTQMESARHQLDEESRTKIALSTQLRDLNTELDAVKCQLDDEVEAHHNLSKEVSKLTNENAQWRKRYETEIADRAKEIDDLKSRFAVKMAEADERFDMTFNKCLASEKARDKLQVEIEDAMTALEKANANVAYLERKQKRFDNLMGEWQKKCESISAELASTQKSTRFYALEAEKLRDQYAESQDEIESLRRENRNLSDEIKSLSDQIMENGQALFDVEKAKKKVELENEGLKIALNEMEAAKEQADAKTLSALTEVENAREDGKRALDELKDEFQAIRRNHERTVDMLQASLDGETMAKKEALTQKDRLSAINNDLLLDISDKDKKIEELRMFLDTMNNDIQRLQKSLDDEIYLTQQARDAELLARKRIDALNEELNDVKFRYAALQRTTDGLELEISHLKNANNDLNAQNSNLLTQRTNLENRIMSMQIDIDEKAIEMRAIEERSNKNASDVARLTEKLKIEQDHAVELDNIKTNLEIQLNDVQNRLAAAESDAFKACRATIQALEDRIQQLEGDYALLSHNYDESQRNVIKGEKKVKDLLRKLDDANKHSEKLTELNEDLQVRMKLLRRQTDQAEEEVALSMARYKNMATELDRAESRLDTATTMMSRFRNARRFGAPLYSLWSSRDTSVPVREYRSLSRQP